MKNGLSEYDAKWDGNGDKDGARLIRNRRLELRHRRRRNEGREDPSIAGAQGYHKLPFKARAEDPSFGKQQMEVHRLTGHYQ